jgi:large subunit ribosomal protein L9
MEIILTEKIEHLGNVGDIVKVKNGYARNFLIPKSKAFRATEDNKKLFEAQKVEILKKNEEITQEAKALFTKADKKVFNLIRQASDEGKLYGSIRTNDVAEAIKSELKIEAKKSQIIILSNIRELGVYEVVIKFHADYTAHVKINVARSEEEAKKQLVDSKKPKKQEVEQEVVSEEKKQEVTSEDSAENKAQLEEKSENKEEVSAE